MAVKNEPDTKIQLNVSPVTSATLKADGTIQCLADIKYQPVPASRHSSTAFALARDLAKELTTALVAQLGQIHTNTCTPASVQAQAQAQAQLYAVQLRRNRILVCFNVFLDHCTPEFRRQMDETVARPIHLDTRVAREIAWIQEIDKGPRPYFTDDMNPLCYDDGIRVEDNLEELPGIGATASRDDRLGGIL
ncbi:hypothetical protein C8A00DRAFT_37035 [Chaetomidium leptoderma]|uniref:Uncharacterized protein n=1 Tax=Chaetomidium leptoderma TaxID=669021 RepID=A0AAN6VFY3_9PEZI|nr:hypothetical protein C8A00DRAFT_37035 [Chaetomidium leptoderma]